MRKQVLTGFIIVLLAGLLLAPSVLAEEIKVPFSAVKPGCYGQIDMSRSEFALSEIGKECVTEEWLEEYQVSAEEKKETSEEKKEKQESDQVDYSSTDWRWGLEKINAPQAWEDTKGEGVVVAVIDSGVNFDYPALQGKAWSNPDEVPGNGIDDDGNGYVDDMHGWDFIDDDPGSFQGSKIQFHGNFVANLAAGATNDSGQGGVAPKAKVMDLRVVDAEDNLGSWKDFIGAFEYALNSGADVVNFSIAFDYGTSLDYYFERAVRKVASEIFIVGGTGNESSSVQLPASMEEIVAATATDRWNGLYRKSNTGSEVVFCAPGVDISSVYKGSYDEADGSSYAVPHITGTVALMLSIDPNLTSEEIKDILAETTNDLGPPGRDEKFGWGLIDAEAAVEKVKEAKEG